MRVKRLKRAGLLKTPTKVPFSFESVIFSQHQGNHFQGTQGRSWGSLNLPQQPLQLEKMSRENEGEAAARHLSHRSIA